MEESPKSTRRSHDTDKHDGNVLEMVSANTPHEEADSQKLTDSNGGRAPERHEKVVYHVRIQSPY